MPRYAMQMQLFRCLKCSCSPALHDESSQRDGGEVDGDISGQREDTFAVRVEEAVATAVAVGPEENELAQLEARQRRLVTDGDDDRQQPRATRAAHAQHGGRGHLAAKRGTDAAERPRNESRECKINPVNCT